MFQRAARPGIMGSEHKVELIEHSLEVKIHGQAPDAVTAQAAGQAGDPRRRFTDFRDRRVNQHY